MILEAVMSFFVGLVKFVVGMIPTNDAPAWLSSGNGYLSQIWASGAGLGAWVPWGLVGTVFAAVIACVGVGLVIKLVRIVASFFTAGGGSAA